MRENELSMFSKIGIIVALLIPMIIIAIGNIYYQEIYHPEFLGVVLFGAILFSIGKLSVITEKKIISFGPRLMTENMANLYRLGYFLMILGILLMFNE